MHRTTPSSRHHAPSRTRRRGIAAATIAIAAGALVAVTASQETAVVGIIHPMQPIGNIDCCH